MTRRVRASSLNVRGWLHDAEIGMWHFVLDEFLYAAIVGFF